MKRGATDAVMVSRGDAKTRRANQEGFGSVRAICSTVYHQTPWPKTKIGNVCDLISGYAFKSSDFGEMGIPVVKIGDITDCYTVNIQNCSRIPTDKLPSQYARFRLNAGDIVVAMTGATAGKMGRISFRKHTETALLNQRVLKVIPRSVDARFFWATISNNAYRKRFYELGIGAAQPNFSSEQFADVEIPIPPLPVQRRIADILSAYDDLIENNRRRIAILEETARLVYRKWLKENNNSLKSTRIGDLIELQNGFAFKSNTFVAKGKYKIITIKNVKDVVVDGENVSYVDDVPERMPQHCYIHSGDILLSLTGNVGRVSVSIDEDGLLNQRVAKVKSDFHWFSLLFLTSTDVFCRMNNLAVGAAQQNLSPVKFCNEMFELPEHSEMALINELVEPLFEQIVSVARFSSKLAAARDMLLPRLMKGEMA